MNLLMMVYLDLNLGDDLFIKCLKDRYKNSKIDIITKRPELLKAFEDDKNISFIEYKNIIKRINKYDAFVVVGGSIFQDYGDKKSYLTYILRNIIIRLFKMKKKPSFVMGSNVGPINTKFGEKIFRNTFRDVTYISVRDKKSHELVLSLEKKANCEVYPDIVFSLNEKEVSNLKCDKLLGISVINNCKDEDLKDEYIKKIAEICNSYLSKDKKNQINLFGFDSGNENDEIIIDKVCEIIDNRNLCRVKKVIYKGNISEFLKDFMKCNYIIATRFHSIILALKYNIKFFPIIYSEKSTNLLTDINFNLPYIEYEKISDLDVNKLINNIEMYNYKINKEYIENSNGHFKYLDEIYKIK